MSRQPQKKSEIQELREQLASNIIKEKKVAIRKIIDAMTRGKDVSMLFMDIQNNINTPDLELKKLIFLYLMSYAKLHPEKAILSVNALRKVSKKLNKYMFYKDAANKANPLLRALAIRTMGCIRVPEIVDYLIDPLKNGLKDEDSYVRKTSVLCVAKMYDINPEVLEEQGFLKTLENMLNDGNAFVLANTLSALTAISESKGTKMLRLNSNLVQKLLTAINEVPDWGQISILDALADYTPVDSQEAENVLDRISSRLQHQNTGIILSSIKLLMKYLDFLSNIEKVRGYQRKLAAPLITLMGNEAEIQYIALRNINLILQKRGNVLEKELKIFFCQFNDPIYVKLEKLEIIVRLAGVENIQQILHELREYVNEVDVEFVRKSIRCIGRCAIKIDQAADKCVKVLQDALKSKGGYVLQESIIVMRDIFRKYPRKFEGILNDICENLKSLDDPEAKSAMIWIIGEYVDSIENADMLLKTYIDTFKEDPPTVQLSILTSCIKLFLSRPNDCYQLIYDLLHTITNECDNPDLRDRGYIYLRLLSINPELAKKVVFAERPAISDQSYTLESELLDQLVCNIGSLASLYYKPPENFVKRLRDMKNQKELEENIIEDPEELLQKNMDSSQMQSQYEQSYQEPAYQQPVYEEQSQQQEQPVQQQQQQQQPQQQQKKTKNLLDDSDEDEPAPQQQQQQQQQFVGQQMGNAANIKIPFFVQFYLIFNKFLQKVCLEPSQAGNLNQVKGVKIEGALQRSASSMYFELKIHNQSNQKLSVLNLFIFHLSQQEFCIKFDSNIFRLAPSQINIQMPDINPGAIQDGRVNVDTNGVASNEPPSFPFGINALLKCNADIFQFTIPCSLSVLMEIAQPLTAEQYSAFQTSDKVTRTQNVIDTQFSPEKIKEKFTANNINFVGSKQNQQGIVMVSYSASLVNKMCIILDTIYDQATQQLRISYAVQHPSLIPLFYQALKFILAY